MGLGFFPVLVVLALAISWASVAGSDIKDGSLILCAKEVFLLANGTRRSFPSADIFSSWGYSFDAVKRIPCNELESISKGPDMEVKPSPPLDFNQTEVNAMLLELLNETAGVYKGEACNDTHNAG